MEPYRREFLAALRAALHGEPYAPQALSADDAHRLFRLAQEQNVLPLTADALWDSPALRVLPELRRWCGVQAARLARRQARRTADFALLYRFLAERGLRPVVLKGAVCRALYPKPELRASADEDLLIDGAEFAAYDAALRAYGLAAQAYGPERSEVTYLGADCDLYIELHLRAFPPDSAAYGDLDRYFADARSRSVTVRAAGTELCTLAPTDHLLYMILHAYKHLLHGGVGVRYLCDIALFAQAYSARIGWDALVQSCRSSRTERLAAAMLTIAEQELGIPMPEAFRPLVTDIQPLLEDCLSGGIYGTQDENRAHSASATLDAVAAQKRGARRKSLLASLFPPVRSLRDRYPYLRRRPWLLPLAWAQRFVQYLRRRRGAKVDPAQTIRIGRSRVELLRQYGIID